MSADVDADDDHDGPTITVGGVVLPITEADIARFDAKVDRSGGPDCCWPWLAGRSSDGYGQIRLSGRPVKAHRLAYVIAHGSVDPQLQIDHMCHRRGCVNPAHLRQATNAENQANRAGADIDSRSGVRGVCWVARVGRWKVQAERDGRRYHGGYHDALEDAEAAVIRLRIRLGIASLSDPDRLAELEMPDVSVA